MRGKELQPTCFVIAPGSAILQEVPFEADTQSICPYISDSKGSTAGESRSWRQLLWTVGINLVALGSNLCVCGGFVYLPPMLRKVGFSENTRGLILCLGPFLCILAVPLLGSWSDRCRSRFGRRRPFLLGLGALLVIALAIVAFIDAICSATTYAPVLALGTVIIDFVSQAMLNPCQSLLHDLVEDTDLGFSVYSFALSLGGFLGYLLSAVDWTGTALGRAGQERAVFLLLLLAMGACLAITLVLAKEKPLASPKGIGGVANEKAVPSPPFSSLAVHDEGFKKGGKWAPTEFNSVKLTSLEPGPTTPKHDPPSKDVVIFSNRISSSETKSLQDKQLGSPPFADGVGACKSLQCVFVLLPAQAVASLRHIPSSLWRLFFFMLLAWMALMSHFLYFSDFTAEVVYHGLPEDSAAKADRLRYDRGVRAASWGLLVNCVAASVYAIGLQCRITERFGQRTGLQLGMGTFAIAMCYLLVLNDFTSILVLSAVMGIAAAAIESIPFALTCFYCENRQEYFKESQHTFGVGQCLALLTTAEYLSQVILTLLMGYVFSATRTPASYVLFAMVSALASVGASAFLVCPPPTAPKKSID